MNLQASQQAIDAGLMVEVNGETHITDAGLFAICCWFATIDEVDEEERRSHAFNMHRVLRAARAAGFDERAEVILLGLLIDDVDPAGKSDKSKLLATICRLVSLMVGAGRMAQVITGTKAH